MKKSIVAISLLICSIGGIIGISRLSDSSRVDSKTTSQPAAQLNAQNKQSSATRSNSSMSNSSTSNSSAPTSSKQEASSNKTTPAAQQSKTSNQSRETCRIKGNISYRTGERIYHVPGQRYYESTQIDTAQGERWFCTEQEAQSAGWRKSKV